MPHENTPSPTFHKEKEANETALLANVHYNQTF